MIGIYKITSPTNRVYIGQSQNLKNRFEKYKNLKGSKKQIRLYNSFMKYDIINHKFDIVEECEISELNIRERYYQDYYDVLNTGGLNCYLTQTDELSREMTIKTKLLLRKINTGTGNPMFGIKGELNSRSRKVINTETNEIYNSLTECCEINNLNPKYMSRWLTENNNRKNNSIYEYL